MDYIIETNFQGSGFVAVPNHVAQNAALSPEALGVLVYFGSLPRGYLLRVASVLERFAMGKDRWQRIARELRDVGAMTTEIVRGAGGRAVGRRVSVRWPDPAETTESRKTLLSVENSVSPKAGKPAKVSRETRQSEPGFPAPYKEQTKKKRAVVCSPSAAPRRVPVARPMVGGSGPAVSDLSEFQKASLWARRSFLLNGKPCCPGAYDFELLRQALRGQSASEQYAQSYAG